MSENRDRANILRAFRGRTNAPKRPPSVAMAETARRAGDAKRARADSTEITWRRTIYTPEMSQAQAVQASGAADGTVSEQRRVLKALQQRWMDAGPHGTLPNPMALTWAEARQQS